MAIRDQVVDLVLRARNALSKPTEDAAASVDQLGDSADELQSRLRSLEDQGALVKNFQQAQKAVDRTASAYERARLRADKLADKIGATGVVTEQQTREFNAARAAVDRAERVYNEAQNTLDELGEEAKQAGIDTSNLSKAQRENAQQIRNARRAIQDYNKSVDSGGTRLRAFGATLASGVVSFGAWATAALAAGRALTVGALTRFTTGQADLARQLAATSAALNINTTDLQGWQFAAEAVGIEGDKVSDIFKDVEEKIADAFINEGGEAVEVIKNLGLNVEELARLSPDEQLLRIAEGLDQIQNNGAKVQILESLASDASLLLPLLDNNAAKLRELQAVAEERGAIIDSQEIERLREFDEAVDALRARFDGLLKQIAVELAPTMTRLAEEFDRALGDQPELIDNLIGKFRTLIEVSGAWVTDLIRDSANITRALDGIFQSVNGVFNLFKSLSAAVISFGLGAGEVLARVNFDIQRLIGAAVRGLNAVGLASDAAVSRAEVSVEAAGELVLELERKSESYKQTAVEAGRAAAAAFSDAGQAAAETGAAVVKATTDAAKLATQLSEAGDEAADTSDSVKTLAADQTELSRRLIEVAAAIDIANQRWSEDPTDENLANIEALRKEYAALQDQLEQLGNTSATAGGPGDGLSDSLRRARDGMDEVDSSTKKTASSVRRLNDDVQDTGDTFDQVSRGAQSSLGGVGAAIGSVVSGWSAQLSRLSSNAAAAFSELVGLNGPSNDAGVLGERLEYVNFQLEQIRGRVSGGGSVSRLLNGWAEAAFSTEQAFLQQAIAVEQMTRRVEEGDASIREINLSAEDLQRRFSLLDERSLAPLIGAIRSAKREVDSLNESLVDTIENTQQELASLRGDAEEVERLRTQERINELQEQLDRARALGDRETINNAKEALRLTEEAHKLRLDQIAEETAAARDRRLAREAEAADDRNRDEIEERQDISRTERRTQQQTNQIDRAIARTVRIELVSPNGSLTTLEALDGPGVNRFLDELENANLISSGA